VRAAIAAVVLAGALLAGCLHVQPVPPAAPSSSAPSATGLVPPRPLGAAPPDHVGHLAVLLLENEDYAKTFPATGTPPSPYLAQTMVASGRLLTQYYGIGHASLDNYIAMVSGQAPNPMTQADCSSYTEFRGTAGGPDGQAIGQGCVYPAAVKTVADQMSAAGVSWRLYAEDMANLPDAPHSCRHGPLGQQEQWGGSSDPRDQYATRHVPFVYFHSIIDDQAKCDSHVVDLSLLPADLADGNDTPRFLFIVPDVCSDGHDEQCANPDQKGGYDGIDGFLRAWVPRIVQSPAFARDGLLVVTFDEAEQSTPDACCNEQPGYNTAMPGITGPGGGRIGAVLLGPCIPPGSRDDTPYNHYSFLRTVEDVWRLPHLGYAGQAGLKPIDLGACAPKTMA